MPIWCYIPLVVLLQLGMTFAVVFSALFVAGKVCRLPASRARRCSTAAMAFTLLGLALSVSIVAADSNIHHPGPVLLAAFLVAPLTLLVALKWTGRGGWGRTMLAWVVSLVVLNMMALPLRYTARHTVLDPYRFPTASMRPTIQEGDRLLVDRTLPPRRWDIVAFHAPPEPAQVYMKRLVGLPGETVEIVDGEVLINGVVSPKPPELSWLRYEGQPPSAIQGPTRGTTGSPIVLRAGEFFVLGDNTHYSLDSRYWTRAPEGVQPGAVPAGMIIGTARVVYGPLSHARVLR